MSASWQEPPERQMRYAAASLVALMLAALPSYGATREDIYHAFQRCNVKGENRVWLDCIYGAAQPMRAELGLPPAPASQVRLVPQTEATALGALAAAPQKRTGLLSYVLGGDREVDEMTFRAYRFDSSGRFTVTLANGQVWRQTDDDRHLAGWKADPARYQASIRTGALGSSILKVRNEPGAFMVKRVP
jgi:hypothetical protein